MIGTYDDIHEQYPNVICLFRVGDFYEAYREDAEKVSNILGIALTQRDANGTSMYMSCFHFHALDTYLSKLVRAGLQVAICDGE